MTCPWSPYGTAMSFSMTMPGRFSNRCSGGRPPRDSGVLRGPRNRYCVVSPMELLLPHERRGGPSENGPPLGSDVGHLKSVTVSYPLPLNFCTTTDETAGCPSLVVFTDVPGSMSG